MNAPVDVLAWIKLATTGLHCLHVGSVAAKRGQEVRAAVADLIAADHAYDAAREAARGFIDDGYEEDSYGVHGSEFSRCLACDAESGAGVLNKGVVHEPDCVRGLYEVAVQKRLAALARVGAA